MKTLHRLLALAAVSATAAVSSQAGTFATITPDGDISDWAGISSSYTGPTGGTVDINQVFIANDADYLYIRVQFTSEINPNSALVGGANNLFLAIDTDNNLATGFNIFGTNQVGSDVGWQNDFPFDQRAGFNSGGVNNGAAGIAPFASSTFEQEYRISLSATFMNDNANVFPALGNTIRILFWSDSGATMATPGMSYTLATAAIPEPSTCAALAGLGVLGLAVLRRRR